MDINRHLVNEYKLQKRKGNSGKKFGKIAEVNTLIDNLLIEAREALLRDVLDDYKVLRCLSPVSLSHWLVFLLDRLQMHGHSYVHIYSQISVLDRL